MISHPSHRPVSALRARMIEDIRVRGFTEKTRNDYVATAANSGGYQLSRPGRHCPLPRQHDRRARAVGPSGIQHVVDWQTTMPVMIGPVTVAITVNNF